MVKNKIADKITSIGKSKEKEKIKKAVQIDIPPKKRQQIIETSNCFDHKMERHCIKMEFQKIVNLFDTTFNDKDLPRFATKKWIEVYDQSEKNYNVNREIRIETPILRSDLFDFSDAYIVVEGVIAVTNPDDAKRNKAVAFKSNPPFFDFISKINDVQINNAEDQDVVMTMSNSLEYSKNYRKATGSLWNYYRDEPSDPLSSNSESFKYKASITDNNYNVGGGKAGYDAGNVGKNETEIVEL